jgi:hypothetical protein
MDYLSRAVSYDLSVRTPMGCQSKTKLVIVFSLVLLLTSGEKLNAQTVDPDPNSYSFYPTSVLSIGVGFSPNDLSRAKAPCIDGKPEALEAGALGTAFQANLVTNSAQLKQSMSIDTKVDASYLAFSGGGHFNFKDDSLFTSDSVTVVVTATTEFGRVGYKKRPKISDDVKALLQDGPAFAKTCGTRYVAIERRGASVSAILTISSVHTEDKQTIVADMHASGGWGPLSGKASTDFQQELTRAATSGRLNFQLVATGGPGFGPLGDVVASLTTNPQSLSAIEKALGDYIKQFTSENSVPIGFEVGSMSDFGWDPNSVDLWNLQKEKQLRAIVKNYRHIESLVESGRSIVEGNDPRTSLLNPKQLKAIIDALPMYESYMQTLAEAHKSCKEKTDLKTCTIPSAQLPPEGTIPDFPAPPDTSYRVQVDGNLLDVITSRAIFFATRGPLLDRVRVYQPAAQHAEVLFMLKGHYLSTASLVFQQNGSAPSAVAPVALLPISVTGVSYHLEGDPSVNKDMDQALLKFMRQYQTQGSGTFYLDVQDQLGRKFRIAVATADWSVSPTQTKLTQMYIEY